MKQPIRYRPTLPCVGTKCRICGTTERLINDHCHAHGWVRGALCPSCNQTMRYADVGLITRTFQARGGHVAALLNHRAQCGECEVIALVPLIVPTPRPRPEPDRAKVLALLDLPAPSTLPSLPERERLRRAQGLTQAQVAEVLGVNRVTVAKWEAGRCEPRGEVREQYAELLRLIAERHPAPDGGGAP